MTRMTEGADPNIEDEDRRVQRNVYDGDRIEIGTMTAGEEGTRPRLSRDHAPQYGEGTVLIDLDGGPLLQKTAGEAVSIGSETIADGVEEVLKGEMIEPLQSHQGPRRKNWRPRGSKNWQQCKRMP